MALSNVALVCAIIGLSVLAGALANEVNNEYDRISGRLVMDDHSQSRVDDGEDLSQQDNMMTPVVFWHGMGDTAFGSINIDRLALQRKYPNMTVFSVTIGVNPVADVICSYIADMNIQVQSVCKSIIDNKLIKKHGAFNAVGFSQGSQFLRAVIQRCPFRENGIRVKNFISLGGQHQGVFGLPRCTSNSNEICELVRERVAAAAYSDFCQIHFVQAQYWHDPNREEQYKNKSIFLADINNENTVNKTYRSNLLALDNIVLVQFDNDTMVIPKQSSLFGFYNPQNIDEIIPLEKTNLYLRDKLGLRQLQLSNRLHQITIPGEHLQYNMTWFLEDIAAKFLDN